MFIAHDHIEQRITHDSLFKKETYDLAMVQQCSYDLRLGEEVYVVGHKAPERLSVKKGYVSLPPGQFAILTCNEWLNMPRDLMAFITLRNTFKMQGLINISGFHVDPTFEGRLLFAVQNVGPHDIRLKHLEPTFTIFFAKIEGNIGKARDRRPLEGIQLEHVQLLGGNSVTLSKLKKDLDRLQLLLLVYAPFAVGAFVALLLSVIKALSGGTH